MNATLRCNKCGKALGYQLDTLINVTIKQGGGRVKPEPVRWYFGSGHAVCSCGAHYVLKQGELVYTHADFSLG